MTITNDAGDVGSMVGAAADRGGAGGMRGRWRRGRSPLETAPALVEPSLDDLRPGETCRVVALHGGGAVRRRLLDMGIVPGARVDVVRNAPLRDPIEIRVGNSFMILRLVEAARIEVVRLPTASR